MNRPTPNFEAIDKKISAFVTNHDNLLDKLLKQQTELLTSEITTNFEVTQQIQEEVAKKTKQHSKNYKWLATVVLANGVVSLFLLGGLIYLFSK
ncbi:MPN272 family protein [Mycoplasmoides pneumoniae]|uniref:Uncharacterized protein n=3 Tax=Mycoplasmoides pneumoniae TaxID=2104 RepID=A0AAX0S3I1_MYCPM|nr:hypothetical protein [Mycoplasmoides pneumoniae]ADK87246.1 conserved hypothetical protein [Mycoplasmoides pneumoniae FH]ALA31107.1 hypothetical protein B434_03015 [Mycoplasmoides pneumoniae 19294]ALA31551.1 hypothetical protein F536_01495 [Mycoplasmoides pneumoniae 39443]ALA35783.1 hypothetical protein F539_01500 [Mycoplasmoides pneumoniae FH]ALA36491.1 hypothetical protein F538_01505 [Mycoplasmoides pneumoniae M1139]